MSRDLLTMQVTKTVPATIEVLQERLDSRLAERTLRKTLHRYGSVSDTWLDSDIQTLKAAIANLKEPT